MKKYKWQINKFKNFFKYTGSQGNWDYNNEILLCLKVAMAERNHNRSAGQGDGNGHSPIPMVGMQIGTTFPEGNLAVNFKHIKMCISCHQVMSHLGLDYMYIKISVQGWSPFYFSLL